MFSIREYLLAGLLLNFATCLGCGSQGPEIARVEGTITLDGNPIPNAAVVFIPQSGRPAGATTDHRGRYVLTFTQGRKGAMFGDESRADHDGPRSGGNSRWQADSGTPESIPVQYNTQSTLEFTVVAGKTNVANFDLVSGGTLPERDVYK